MGYTYVLSDIHGASKSFYKMLEKIEFNFKEDVLIIDGDIVDRNKDSLKLFFEIVDMEKKYPGHVEIIKGNHELFMEMYIKGTLSRDRYSSYHYGGADTIREIEGLSREERGELVKYLENLPLYREYKSPIRGDMVITHTGLHFNNIIRSMDGSVNVIRSIEQGHEFDAFQFFISSYIQREAPAVVIRDLDKCLLVGHVPTMFIADSPTQGIWAKSEKLILIDCGSGFDGGKLGCLRLEDERVFYV